MLRAGAERASVEAEFDLASNRAARLFLGQRFFRDPLTWLRVLVKLRLQRFDPLREIERARGSAEISTLGETKEV